MNIVRTIWNGYAGFSLIILMLTVFIYPVQAQTSCDQCGADIQGDYVVFDGNSYHKICYKTHIQLRCDHCGEVIDGKYNISEGQNYHPSCYRENIQARCDICGQPLSGEYYTDYWGNSFHVQHSHELPECSTCGRVICQELTGGGFELSDGRYLCSLCEMTSVTDDYQIQSALRYTRRILEGNFIRDLPTDIPVTLVDQKALKRISNIYNDSMRGFTDHNMSTRNGVVISRDSHIYILSNLPRTMFRAVLAHELLHVYLFERDLDLRSDIREGFCNLGSALVYQDVQSEFARYQLENMQESPDPDYGAGYRKMSGLLYQKGWQLLLRDLAKIR